MTDYQKMRQGVGQLLAELMRIKAEGDYAAIKALVDTYGVHFDPKLRDQVVARYKALKLPSVLGRHERRAHEAGRVRARSTACVSARPRAPIPGLRRDVRRKPEGARTMTTPAASHADTRQYLLERVDEAAVVQLYADGFDALRAPREDR